MKILLTVLGLIPALIKVITAVEESFPQSGAGADKLALIKTIMTETYAATTELWPTLEAIISAVVSFANKIGAFVTAAKAG